MTVSSGRRRSDRAAWPVRDRVRWQRARFCGFMRTSALGFAVILAIFLGLGAIGLTVYSDHQDDRNRAAERKMAGERDEARKYQACVQRKRGLRNQNAGFEAIRDSLLTGARRQRLQGHKTKDAALKRRFLLGARLAVKRRARIRLSPLPKCKTTYPTGYRSRFQFPDLAKQGTVPPPPLPPR